MIRVLDWLIKRGFFGQTGPQWLATGEYLYAVTIARAGRIIEVVRVRADTEDEAAIKAQRYTAANIYALKVVRQERAHADR